MTSREFSAGRCYPLGASPGAGGTNFAVYSETAAQLWLLLFDRADGQPTDVIPLQDHTKYIWHAFVSGVGPGQFYAFKAVGEYDPGRGLYFNENKLLLDPYAKALTGKPANVDNLLLGYSAQTPGDNRAPDARDNSAVMPKCIVVDGRFDWQGDAPLDLAPEKLIIYETHLKGFTAHPSSKAAKPGTYLGFIEKIGHLKDLGINAVELLPLQEFFIEDFLTGKGLTNYWGYNTMGFFAPESSYAAGREPGCQVTEFKTLVRELHKAGIEVILDVVYNHTGEGNELGPTLSFKGLDNPTYYCLTGTPAKPRGFYMNFTGCGNSLNLANPPVIRLVMDSLRYWVQEMHVDGFRFDLASVLGREEGAYRKSASFFDAIAQDPVLNHIKLIAEPWDLGTYEVGEFPVDWSEWNGRFRDTMRRFCKGDGGQVRDLGFRLTGSSDLYGDDGRSPFNSVNFITCHDGFTLNDLVSYNEKHNEANLEGNNDGTNDNNSWNCGAEGETGDAAVLSLRRRLAKNYACCLLLSSGTPMMLGGDEFLRTQRGNNNAYCQDNELGWHDWALAQKNADFLAFFRKLIALTRRFPVLQRRKFMRGNDSSGNGVPDIDWFGKDGGRPDWDNGDIRTLCYQLDGAEEVSEQGDYRLFILLNADPQAQSVRLPPLPPDWGWRRVLDTSLPAGEDFAEPGREAPIESADSYLAGPRSTVVLLGKKKD